MHNEFPKMDQKPANNERKVIISLNSLESGRLNS